MYGDREVVKPKVHWTDSICYIAALMILGFIGFAATGVMVYQYYIGFGGGTSTGIPAATSTSAANNILQFTQNYGPNYDPTQTVHKLLSNPMRDPLSGTIFCTGPDDTRYEEGDKYNIPVTDCMDATCTCGVGGNCPNNPPTCCLDKDGAQCAFGASDCARTLTDGQGNSINGFCTCNSGGSFSSCYAASDPCQGELSCGTDDVTGEAVCGAGTQYKKKINDCQDVTCTCGVGGNCPNNPPTCCLDKDGGQCALGASGCARTLTDGQGNQIDGLCTCNSDGLSFSSCYDASDPCQGGLSCGTDYVTGEAVCGAGTEYKKKGSDCQLFTCTCGGGSCTGETPTCCVNVNGGTCAIGASGCEVRLSDGTQDKCTCGVEGAGYVYSNCEGTQSQLPCGGGTYCPQDDGSIKCPGDQWSFLHPSNSAFTCTCTCGESQCDCVYTG